MTALLMNEPPLQVLPSLAAQVGLNEAIVLQQLHYWLSDKFRTPDKVMDGKNWVYNTYAQWVEQFPFWGEKTIRRVMGNLEEAGLVLSFVKAGFHKVKYYTINYEGLHSLEGGKSEKALENKYVPASGQVDQIDVPIWAEGQKEKECKTLGFEPSLEGVEGHQEILKEGVEAEDSSCKNTFCPRIGRF